MSDAAELRKVVKQLQNASSPTEIVNILNVLKNEHQVTEAVLRESKIGLAVGKLRTNNVKEVSDLAKEIVKKWKGAVEKAKLNGNPGKTLPNGMMDKKPYAPSKSATPVTPTASSAKTDLRTSKTDGIKGGTGDNTRDKCIELIYDALASDATAPADLILRRAQGIEKSVYNDFDGTTAGYKTKIRSLFVNLKDKNNPSLKENVVSGDLPVEKFTKMTSQEMASEERKAADNKIRQDNFHKSLAAGEQEAETDAFQCSRCKQRKCRYRQAQTRSADEPMTTFVTCTVCNHRWKFS